MESKAHGPEQYPVDEEEGSSPQGGVNRHMPGKSKDQRKPS